MLLRVVIANAVFLLRVSATSLGNFFGGTVFLG